MADINLTLTVGDALEQTADLAIIGSGPRLLAEVERRSGQLFEPLSYSKAQRELGLDAARRVRTLSAPDFAWKNVAALSGRSSSRVRYSFHEEVSDTLVLTIGRFEPRHVLLVPYRHDHPEVVAATLLAHLAWYSIWYRSADSRSQYNVAAIPRPSRFPASFQVVDLEDVSPFVTLLADGASRLRAFAEREGERFWHTQFIDPDIDFPHFEVREGPASGESVV